jgi:hypothetical protein
MYSEQVDLERELSALFEIDVLHKSYVVAAYATGSMLAGFGTPTSDLDVVILVADEGDKELARQDGALRRHGSVKADFEVFTLEEFSITLNSCSDFHSAWDTSAIYRLGPRIRLLSQFTAGIHILKPSAELSEFAKRVVALRTTLLRLSVTRAVIYGNNTHEDVLGLILQKDQIGSLRRSHDLLEFGMDAWCTSQGSIYPDDRFKWLWRRLKLVLPAGNDLSELQALYVPELTTEQLPNVTQRRISTTQALLAQALIAAWAPNPQALRSLFLPRWSKQVGMLWRSPKWMSIKGPVSWGLGEDFRFYEMPLAAIIAWACADGRTARELESIIIEQCRIGFGTNVDSAVVQRAITVLMTRGALQDGHPGQSTSAGLIA